MYLSRIIAGALLFSATVSGKVTLYEDSEATYSFDDNQKTFTRIWKPGLQQVENEQSKYQTYCHGKQNPTPLDYINKKYGLQTGVDVGGILAWPGPLVLKFIPDEELKRGSSDGRSLTVRDCVATSLASGEHDDNALKYNLMHSIVTKLILAHHARELLKKAAPDHRKQVEFLQSQNPLEWIEREAASDISSVTKMFSDEEPMELAAMKIISSLPHSGDTITKFVPGQKFLEVTWRLSRGNYFVKVMNQYTRLEAIRNYDDVLRYVRYAVLTHATFEALVSLPVEKSKIARVLKMASNSAIDFEVADDARDFLVMLSRELRIQDMDEEIKEQLIRYLQISTNAGDNWQDEIAEGFDNLLSLDDYKMYIRERRSGMYNARLIRECLKMWGQNGTGIAGVNITAQEQCDAMIEIIGLNRQNKDSKGKVKLIVEKFPMQHMTNVEISTIALLVGRCEYQYQTIGKLFARRYSEVRPMQQDTLLRPIIATLRSERLEVAKDTAWGLYWLAQAGSLPSIPYDPTTIEGIHNVVKTPLLMLMKPENAAKTAIWLQLVEKRYKYADDPGEKKAIQEQTWANVMAGRGLIAEGQNAYDSVCAIIEIFARKGVMDKRYQEAIQAYIETTKIQQEERKWWSKIIGRLISAAGSYKEYNKTNIIQSIMNKIGKDGIDESVDDMVELKEFFGEDYVREVGVLNDLIAHPGS